MALRALSGCAVTALYQPAVRAAVSVNYERLQDSVAESPLVKNDYVLGFFGGFAWTF